MEAKALKNLGHSCFLNSTVQAILGIPAVSAVLSTIENDFALREGLRKVHIDRRSECIDRMRTVLQTAMDKGRRGTARSTSVKLDRLLEMLPKLSSSDLDDLGVAVPVTPGRSMNEVVDALNRSFTDQLLRLHLELLSEAPKVENSWSSSSSELAKRRRTRQVTPVVSPMAFYLSYLCHSSLLPEAFEQNDVSEFLFFLIDQMNAELVKARRSQVPFGQVSFDGQFSSEILDLFRGFSSTRSLCGECGFISESVDSPFIELQLEIPLLRLVVEYFLPPHGWQVRRLGLLQCIRSSLVKRCSESNCDSCGSAASQSSETNLTLLPQILILNLNRAGFLAGQTSKNTAHVHLEAQLDLGSCAIQQPSFVYELAAVIVHQGRGSVSGHYTCFSRRASGWKYFNDAHQVQGFKTTASVISEIEKNTKHYQPVLVLYQKTKIPSSDKECRFTPLARGSLS